MADELQSETSDVTTTTEVPPAIGEKKFTQQDLDQHITNRLNREKATNQKAISDAKSEALTFKTENENLKAVNERYESTLKKIVDAQMKNLAKPVRDLLSKLDPAEQFEWLEENAGEVITDNKKPIPATPKAAKDNQPDAKSIKASNSQYRL